MVLRGFKNQQESAILVNSPGTPYLQERSNRFLSNVISGSCGTSTCPPDGYQPGYTDHNSKDCNSCYEGTPTSGACL